MPARLYGVVLLGLTLLGACESPTDPTAVRPAACDRIDRVSAGQTLADVQRLLGSSGTRVNSVREPNGATVERWHWVWGATADYTRVEVYLVFRNGQVDPTWEIRPFGCA